jgi:2-succinyl-6-hydroxy-2,4-cyclohexadiene-1-carboxylate synthase
MPDCWSQLSRLSMPVTLVVGDQDSKFTRIAQEMAPLIPDVEVVTVPGCGHNVPLEKPEAVASLLT